MLEESKTHFRISPDFYVQGEKIATYTYICRFPVVLNNGFYKYHSFRIACLPLIRNTVPVWHIKGVRFMNSGGK